MNAESGSSGGVKKLIWVLFLAAIPLVSSFFLGARVSLRPFGFEYIGTSGSLIFFQALLQDLAVAVLIAWTVKELIERDYERRQQVAIVAGAEASRRAVLRVLFGSFFDDETLEEVYRTIFTSMLVRKNMTVSYRISPHPKSAWLIKLEVMFEYTITNMSTTTVHFDPSTSVWNYAAIFRNDSDLSVPKLKSVKIGRNALSKAEIGALNAAVNRNQTPVKFPIGVQEMRAGDALEVRIAYEREKLLCDSDVMRMNFPTKKVTMTVDNACAPELEIEVREIGQQGFTPKDCIDADGAKWKCVNEGILLANNGWVLYWYDTRLRPTEMQGPRRGAPVKASAA